MPRLQELVNVILFECTRVNGFDVAVEGLRGLGSEGSTADVAPAPKVGRWGGLPISTKDLGSWESPSIFFEAKRRSGCSVIPGWEGGSKTGYRGGSDAWRYQTNTHRNPSVLDIKLHTSLLCHTHGAQAN